MAILYIFMMCINVHVWTKTNWWLIWAVFSLLKWYGSITRWPSARLQQVYNGAIATVGSFVAVAWWRFVGFISFVRLVGFYRLQMCYHPLQGISKLCNRTCFKFYSIEYGDRTVTNTYCGLCNSMQCLFVLQSLRAYYFPLCSVSSFDKRTWLTTALRNDVVGGRTTISQL